MNLQFPAKGSGHEGCDTLPDPNWAHSSARLERVPDKDEVRGSSPRGPTKSLSTARAELGFAFSPQAVS